MSTLCQGFSVPLLAGHTRGENQGRQPGAAVLDFSLYLFQFRSDFYATWALTPVLSFVSSLLILQNSTHSQSINQTPKTAKIKHESFRIRTKQGVFAQC